MPPPTALPVSAEGCRTYLNMSSSLDLTLTSPTGVSTNIVIAKDYSVIEEFYKISYVWYNTFGTVVFVIVSLVVSFITGPTDPKEVDCKLMVPLFYKICIFLPEQYRRVMLFGVDYEKKEEKNIPLNKHATLNDGKENLVHTQYDDDNKINDIVVTHL